ncbi:MAG: hypothetical protein U1G05_01600 [Kiritimatiellia bacterium]
MSNPVIAGFELLEKLGEGGAGAVFKARQLSLGRMVAIKVLPSHMADDPQHIERFKEAQTAAQLKHPGIAVTCHDETSWVERPVHSSGKRGGCNPETGSGFA